MFCYYSNSSSLKSLTSCEICCFFVRSVNNDPYNCNPLCQGYTGALAYYLWSKEEGGPIEKMDANLPPIDDDDTCSIISGIEVYSQVCCKL